MSVNANLLADELENAPSHWPWVWTNEERDLIVKALRSYVSRDGWKLVPAEATAEMVQAAEDRHVEGARYIAENSIQFALWREVWRAMLQAAPRCEVGDASQSISNGSGN